MVSKMVICARASVLVCLVIGAVGSTACGTPPTSDNSAAAPGANGGALTREFPGTWELVSIDLKDASGDPMPAPAPPGFGSGGATGQLVAGRDGFIGLAIMQQGRTKGEELSPEEAVTDVDAYTAMFGTYSVVDSSNLVTVQIQGSRDPRLTGTVQTSVVTLSGDTMTMELPLSASGIQPAYHWRKLPELTGLTPTHERVIGFWRHVPNEGDTAEDPPLRPGFIIYSAAGRMMVHLMGPERSVYAGLAPTPEEAQATVGSYTSYFGPFSVDEAGGYFVHHRIGHTNDLTDRPKTERRTGLDTDAQRFYEFVGNRMVLRYLSTSGVQPVPAAGEADWGGMITWERLSAGSGQ